MCLYERGGGGGGGGGLGRYASRRSNPGLWVLFNLCVFIVHVQIKHPYLMSLTIHCLVVY